MLKPWKYDLIEQYFAAEISDEDLKKFQKLIKTDPSFLQEVQKYASQAALLEDYIAQNITQPENKQELKHLFQQAVVPQSDVKNIRFARSPFFLRIAALLAILILFSWVIYTASLVQPLENLTNQHEKPEVDPQQKANNENEQEEPSTQSLDTSETEDLPQEPDSQNITEEITQENIQEPVETVSIDSTSFYPNTNLENQMLALVSSRASLVLTQISPSNNQHLKNHINFKWVLENVSVVTLEVFNNQKEIILEQDFDNPSQGV